MARVKPSFFYEYPAGELWSYEDSQYAIEHGWLFTNFPAGLLAIRRVDLPEDGSPPRFASDAQAIMHVAELAAAGSDRHQRALRLMGHRSASPPLEAIPSESRSRRRRRFRWFWLKIPESREREGSVLKYSVRLFPLAFGKAAPPSPCTVDFWTNRVRVALIEICRFGHDPMDYYGKRLVYPTR